MYGGPRPVLPWWCRHVQLVKSSVVIGPSTTKISLSLLVQIATSVAGIYGSQQCLSLFSRLELPGAVDVLVSLNAEM